MKRYCLALDLVDDPALISEYEFWHKKDNSWPEVIQSITDSGILEMEIYRTGNRLFMIMEVDEAFDFEKKVLMDASNIRLQEWENLMWKFQQALPWAKKGQKWVLMKRIFEL